MSYLSEWIDSLTYFDARSFPSRPIQADYLKDGAWATSAYTDNLSIALSLGVDLCPYRLMEVCTQHPYLVMHNYDGKVLGHQPLPQKLYGANSYNGRRGEFRDILLKYAEKIGVDIRFNQNVTEYWECGAEGKVGVIVNGERLAADVVVGADGVRSRARELVLVSRVPVDDSSRHTQLRILPRC